VAQRFTAAISGLFSVLALAADATAPRTKNFLADCKAERSEVSMPIRTTRSYALPLACFVLFASTLAGAQAKTDRQKPPASPGADYSGMYSFLRDGEFVQITVEDHGRVTGFVSRFGDSESDRGVFLDHFFKSGKLDANQLAFTTDTVHGVSFEFQGTVERGDGKSRGDEAYYVLKGTVVENTTDEAKKTSSRSREVALKSFPQDMAAPQEQKSRYTKKRLRPRTFVILSVLGGSGFCVKLAHTAFDGYLTSLAIRRKISPITGETRTSSRVEQSTSL
jgi:hypothetical protein